MYAKYIKRLLDFLLSFFGLLVLSPMLLLLFVAGAIIMKGNPLFIQARPGKNEEIFHLIKFRTMTCEKDQDGKLLPDPERLTKYGKFLRATSLDELPELINILKGDMSIVGPRPLGIKYLPYYTDEERRRHSVLPGLTGLAQVRGRNNLSWEEKFSYDIQYVDNVSFLLDVKIVLDTVVKVLKHEGIGQGEQRPVSLHIERERAKQKEGVGK